MSTRPPDTAPKPLPRPSVPIDPRIRQRRIEVRRDEGRRRLRVILVLAGLMAAFLLGWGITRTPFLDVDTVRVTGTGRTTPAQVIAASGVHRGMAMFDVHAGTARDRIEAMPWVRTARVERHWPSTVTIEVHERQPVASLLASGGIAVVDASGRVLTVTPPPPTLPVLLGLPVAGAPGTRIGGRAADLLAVAKAMPPSVVPKVAGVAAADGGQVELRLHPSGIVRLGPPDKLAEKLLAVETVLGQVDLSHLAVLDVRVPASPAITRA